MISGRASHCEINSFEDLPIHVVNQVVTLQHRLCHIDVGCEKSIQSVANHADAELRHPGNINVQTGIRPRQEIHHPLGNVHSLVSHPLQVCIDFDAGYDETQVNRHGLLHGEEIDGHFVNI